ncbi:MAG TPA: DnaA/Hda family protein [Candidatus Hydrogenedens sp.]|nr:DnaA/Hda family protein [Candidatus Hydrogenedens sp.]
MLSWRKDSEGDKKGYEKTRSSTDKEVGVRRKSSDSYDSHGGIAHKRLGELLLEEKLITSEQLTEALKIQTEDGDFLGKILIEKGFVSQSALSACLARQCKIPQINLSDYDISSEIINLIPEEVCRKKFLLPMEKIGRVLTIAMVDPLDTQALEEVKSYCPELRVKPILCSWEDLNKAFDKFFRKGQHKTNIMSALTVESLGLEEVKPVETGTKEKADEEIILPASALEEVEKVSSEKREIENLSKETETTSVSEIPVGMGVIIDTSIVQAIQELPRVLSESIRESLTQININIPTQSMSIAPSPSITEERFVELTKEIRNSFQETIKQVAQEIRSRLGEDLVSGQAQIAATIQKNISSVFQEAIATMITQLREELSLRENKAQSNIEHLAEVMKNGISELSQQLLYAISKELQNSTQTMNQVPIEVAKTIEGVVEKVESRDQKLLSQTITPEKMQEVLITVKESIVNGLQTTLENAVVRLVKELKDESVAEEPDPILVNLTEAIQKLDNAIIENQKMQELQIQKFTQLTESVFQTVHQTTSQTLNEIRKDREQENHELAKEKSIVEPLIPELKEVVQQLKESVQKTQEIHGEQTEKISRLTETTLESVQQTAQLVETLSIMEGKRVETLEEKKQRLSSIAPFGKDSTNSSAEFEESDKEVWKALESEQPLETLTFENFFPGSVNAFTFKLSKAVAENPGVEYNPYFLYGNVGIGKTHLISAIGNEILKKHPKMRVGYVSASHFSRRLAEAIKEGALDLFRENYCHWDVLILDDIQFMGGKVEAQEEFFHVFNVLHQSKRQIIIASDKAPDRLGMLEQRLVSRFSSGIVAELKSPEWETRMQILRNQVKESGVPVPEEVLSLIAMRVPNDIRKMMGSLKKIIAFAKLVGQNITCEMADEILSHLGVVAA